MATVTVQLTTTCSGGAHLRFTVSGDVTATVPLDAATILEPISDVDKEAFVRTLCRIAKIGRTAAQAKGVMQTGVTVTV